MNIRKIIKEEIGKIISENYPMGAEHDPNAPYNQSSVTRPGETAGETKFDLIFNDEREFAIFKGPGGDKYVLFINSIDKDEFEPFAEREKEFTGKDEEGFPDFELGDWEITDEVVSGYVNSNIGDMRVGSGFNDADSGEYDFVKIDDELRSDLAGMVKYFKSERLAKGFLQAISEGGSVSESGVTDKIVSQQTMDTPTGTLFVIDIDKDGLKENNIRGNK